MFGGRFAWQGGLDCAGFVCQLFTDRLGIDIDPGHDLIFTNAQRMLDACDPVYGPDAQPGDLVFFEGTYQTLGASHVGIVKDPAARIMLDDHSGRVPGIGETHYGSVYWQQHFLSFGRVRR